MIDGGFSAAPLKPETRNLTPSGPSLDTRPSSLVFGPSSIAPKYNSGPLSLLLNISADFAE
jgi:hypothetical protein